MEQFPNEFPVRNDQGVKRKSPVSLAEIRWPFVIGIVLLIVVVLIAAIVINDLSTAGSGLGSMAVGWFKGASINPADKAGFTRFLRLVLTGGFICLLLIIVRTWGMP
jgi:hypothetical protein